MNSLSDQHSADTVLISDEILIPTQTIPDPEVVPTDESDDEFFDALEEQPPEEDTHYDSSDDLPDAIKQELESREDAPVVTSSVKRSAEDALESNEEIDSKKRKIISGSVESEDTPQTATASNNEQSSLVKRKLEDATKHDEIIDQHTSDKISESSSLPIVKKLKVIKEVAPSGTEEQPQQPLRVITNDPPKSVATTSEPLYGGFGRLSGFGESKAAGLPSTAVSTSINYVPSLSFFANRTASPFAARAAATARINAWSLNRASFISSTTEGSSKESDNENEHANNESIDNTTTSTITTVMFGEPAKVKVPGIERRKVTTGEESEEVICQTKGRLYVMNSAQNWKEYGVGIFRLNKSEKASRLVMRTDGVYRLILNAKIFPGIKVSVKQDKFVCFGTMETKTNENGTSETKLVNYALKLGSPSAAQNICQHIISCIPASHQL
ncbi:PH domain-like protein [Backusella circina FSU 941]|nr:PH domain-like protein [Backusella circina FSU 941]